MSDRTDNDLWLSGYYEGCKEERQRTIGEILAAVRGMCNQLQIVRYLEQLE